MLQHQPDAGRDADGRGQEHGPDQLPVTVGRVRRHCALQLPRHDPTLDVSYGSAQLYYHETTLVSQITFEGRYGTVSTVHTSRASLI